MGKKSTRDYPAEIDLVTDQNLKRLLLRLTDQIAQAKEDLTGIATSAVASESAIADLTSRIAKLETTVTTLAVSGGFQDFIEISDAPAPGADVARIYSRDNGSGKTQFVVRFPSGAVQVIATQP